MTWVHDEMHATATETPDITVLKALALCLLCVEAIITDRDKKEMSPHSHDYKPPQLKSNGMA